MHDVEGKVVLVTGGAASFVVGHVLCTDSA